MYTHAHHRRAYYSSLCSSPTPSTAARVSKYRERENEIARPLPRPLQDQLFCVHVNKTRAPDHLIWCLYDALFLSLSFCPNTCGAHPLANVTCLLFEMDNWLIRVLSLSLCDADACAFRGRIVMKWRALFVHQSECCSLWSFGALITGRKWKLSS